MPDAAITHPTAPPLGLSSVLGKNINRMQQQRGEEKARTTFSDRLSDRITAFAGSMAFVVVHAVLYGAWIAINLSVVAGLKPFDPSFVILAMEASVEAIFLSTFVLISQNRMMGAAAKHSDLDLQINLLTEHELTRLAAVIDAMAKKMGVEVVAAEELDEIKRDVSPEAVLNALDRADQQG